MAPMAYPSGPEALMAAETLQNLPLDMTTRAHLALCMGPTVSQNGLEALTDAKASS